jgi:hypothetical protein
MSSSFAPAPSSHSHPVALHQRNLLDPNLVNLEYLLEVSIPTFIPDEGLHSTYLGNGFAIRVSIQDGNSQGPIGFTALISGNPAD